LDTFKLLLDASSQFLFGEEDLPTLLSAVKVWCDWLLGNNDTWYPVVKEEPFTQLARLATHLENLKPLLRPVLDTFVSEERYSATSGGEKAFELVKLGEDALLCGFGPWFGGLDWSVYRRYCPRAVPSTLAQDARRLDAINFCVDFLEGLEPPILKWSLPDNAHISLVETATSTQEKVSSRLAKMLASDQDVLEESYSDDDLPTSKMAISSSAGPVLDEKHSRLKLRKDELERLRQEEEWETRRMQRQILSEHVSVTLEVLPRVVVPDTNCFVDHLPEIRRLSQSGPFQVLVPLVVLAELDGLAKGSARYASRQHAAMVQDGARRAMAFLRGERAPNLRCVTSKGTPVHNLSVITEEDAGDGKSNDDLILEACLRVSSSKEERSGKMRVLYRDGVLLTDDRNLKVKAHVADVPVNKITDFIKWAFGTQQQQSGDE
jgi:protein SMG6